MDKDRKNKAEASPFPKCGEFATAMSDLDDCLRALRETAKTGADMPSAARSIAVIQVDLIASSLGLLRYVDELAFQFQEEECSPQERIRRLGCLMRLTGRIQGTILRAIDIYLDCFGGQEAITIQAMAEWFTHLRERSPDVAAQVEQILKRMIEKSAK
jgi:hypothetical protein